MTTTRLDRRIFALLRPRPFPGSTTGIDMLSAHLLRDIGLDLDRSRPR